MLRAMLPVAYSSMYSHSNPPHLPFLLIALHRFWIDFPIDRDAAVADGNAAPVSMHLTGLDLDLFISVRFLDDASSCFSVGFLFRRFSLIVTNLTFPGS